jgi:hypothetical protein
MFCLKNKIHPIYHSFHVHIYGLYAFFIFNYVQFNILHNTVIDHRPQAQMRYRET